MSFFALARIPTYLKELAEPILPLLNEHADKLDLLAAKSSRALLANLITVMESIETTSEDDSIKKHANLASLIGRLAQELDFPSAIIGDFFRTHDHWRWLAPFIASWHLSQGKPQEARTLIENAFNDIKSEVEGISSIHLDDVGKIQSYLEALRIKCLLQLENPDESTFSLTLRKAMTFLEKLKEKDEFVKHAWSSYMLRFSAIQLSSELKKPDLDVIEAIERNVADILTTTSDLFSKLQFQMVLTRALALLKEHHKLKTVLEDSWQQALETAHPRMIEEIATVHVVFSLLRLDFSLVRTTLSEFQEKILEFKDHPQFQLMFNRYWAFLQAFRSFKKEHPDLEDIDDLTHFSPDYLSSQFLQLYVNVHAKTENQSNYHETFQILKEKARTHDNEWIEACTHVLELKWHLMNENIGLFNTRINAIQTTDTHGKLMKYPFFKLQLLTSQTIAVLLGFWTPSHDLDQDKLVNLLQSLSSLLQNTNIPELMAMGLKLKTLSHLINGNFNEIFTLAQEIKNFNKDLLSDTEKNKYNLFIAQLEWLEREIAVNETLVISPYAEPPSPDSPGAFRSLFFNDEYMILTTFIAIISRILQLLFLLDFCILKPDSLSFDLVMSFFSEK